jgi:hypothetical protein
MFTQNKANNFSAKAEFIFEDVDTISLEYNIQDISLPSRTLSPTLIARAGNSAHIPGDSIDIEQSLELNFILDENLEVMFTLMEIQNKNFENGKSNDLLVVNIFDNKHKNIVTASFTKAWIEQIGGIQYSTKGQDTIIFIPVVVSYLDYNLEKVN